MSDNKETPEAKAPSSWMDNVSPEEIQAVSNKPASWMSSVTPEELASLKPEPMSELESGAYGLAKGGTLGFASTLAGGAGATADVLSDPSKIGQFLDIYRQRQQQSEKQFEEAERQNPIAFKAGNIAGGIGTMLIPGLGELSLGKAAALGAATGVGTSKANIIGPNSDIGRVAEDAAIGGGLGAAGYGVGKALGKFFTPETRESAASIQAAKAAGVPLKKEFSGSQYIQDDVGNLGRAALRDRQKNIGKTAIETGSLPFTGGSEAIFNKVQEAIDDVSKQITPLLEEANGKLASVSEEKINDAISSLPDEIGDRLQDISLSLRTGKVTSKIADDIEEHLAPFIPKIQQAGHDIQDLNGIKQDIYKQVRAMGQTPFEQRNSSYKPLISAYKQVAGMISEQINKLGELAEPGLGNQITNLNQKYGNLQELASGSFNQSMKDIAQDSALGVKDMGAAGIAAYGVESGHPILGAVPLAMRGASKAAENLTGNPLNRLANIALAKGNYKLAQMLKSEAGGALADKATELASAIPGNSFTQSVIHSQEPSAIGPMLYSASQPQLKEVSDKLKANKFDHLGDALDQAVNNDDSQKKNAVIFAIMQNPDARSILGSE